MAALIGTVERITYYNDENGYGVIKIEAEGKLTVADAAGRDGLVTVVGTMLEISVGMTAQFDGDWIEDPRYGKQFRADTFTPSAPTSERGLVAFLGSGIVPGIGERTAERIVKHFGLRTLEVLDHQPERLHDVPGLKRKLADDLGKAWVDHQTTRNTMIYLQSLGVSSRMAVRILGQYGTKTVPTIKEDPYALADDVFGIGFIKADAIARNMGITDDDEKRLRAGLSFALNQLSKDGHVYAPRLMLISKTAELLRVDNNERIEAVLTAALLRGDVIRDRRIGADEAGEAIYLPLFYQAERDAAERIFLLNDTPSKLTEEAKALDWTGFLAELSGESHIELSAQQQGAVKAALINKVSVLTGGPGTGKTTTLRMVIHALQKLKYTFALGSPTGRAAKRLAEATEQFASTLHRMLGFIPGEGFSHDEDNPLEPDVIIVDEASMIDLLLFDDLLKAIKPESHLMLVGDVDQLPSVGAGNVLRDMIGSGAAHVTRLQAIFRQSEQSQIIVNAHRINSGEAPFTDNRSTDFFFFGEDDAAAAGDLIVDVVKKRLPARFGIDPMNDVQVIAPMYRGPAGVHALNDALQKALNGEKRTAEKQIGGRLYRVGDKVMQTRNNYEKDVFNGDIGRIAAIDFEDSQFEIVFDNRFIYYDFVEAEELIHAYCISTHRSQGSEYPVVVMPLLTGHYMMLQRNLLYTAVTRAKKMVVLVGSRKAIHMAVGNNKVVDRYTALQPRLQDRRLVD